MIIFIFACRVFILISIYFYALDSEFDDLTEAQEAADISGISAVVMAFLCFRRNSNFNFNLEDTLEVRVKNYSK